MGQSATVLATFVVILVVLLMAASIRVVQQYQRVCTFASAG